VNPFLAVVTSTLAMPVLLRAMAPADATNEGSDPPIAIDAAIHQFLQDVRVAHLPGDVVFRRDGKILCP